MCRKFICLFSFVFVLSLTCTSYVSAKIIYVDATDGEAGNTTLATGEVFTADDPGTAGSGADGLWRKRAFANEGTIFESGGSWEADLNTEDCPRLMTSITVPQDDYAVYAYFWADGDPWRIQASLTDSEGDLPLFLANDPNSAATVAVAEDFAESVPMLTEGNRTLWQVYLGTTGITTTITVYIDDDPNHLSGSLRSWYDGIGYEPAPAKIIYVDATDGEAGNTTFATATGEVFAPSDPGTAGSGADGLWRKRAFANEVTIYESGGSWEADLNTEDCPRLVTSVDVPLNDYEVYVYFWADGDPWRIQASLMDSEGDLPLYLANDPNGGATLAVAEDFAKPVPLLVEGNRTLWQAYLGTTGPTTMIIVYIDDEAAHITGSKRTWYDGIGYKVVPPKIFYVDATEGETGNTMLSSGNVFTSTTDGSGSDNLWRGRAYANSATVFESGGQYGDTANPEDCPRLATLVEVPLADYSVYAYFWSDTSDWRIRASLMDSEDELPLFLANDPNGQATVADVNDFAEPVPMLAEGNRTLWQIYLGTTGPTTMITVYIDDDPNHLTHNGRTWYDGIGYKIAPPKIIYVDATDGETGNTTFAVATGEVFEPNDPGTAGSGADGLWRKRAFANEVTIYESGGSWEADLNTEDCPRLVTSVDVPLNDYDVYVCFWADGDPWRIQASLVNSEGDLPLYLANDPNSAATLAVAEDFAEPVPMLAEGNRTLWQAYLGTTGLTTMITVYIDDDPNHITGSKRTWYDGIGYKVVSVVEAEPEPEPEEEEPEVILPEPVDPGVAGLVAHYAFENNTDDSSGNGLNGTVMGDPTYATGPDGYGMAMDFDGVDDYVDCGNPNNAFDITGQITVSAWVNIRSIPTAWAAIVVKGETGWRLSAYSSQRSFHFGVCDWNLGNYSADGMTEVELNEWHHVCGTFDGATIELYLDAAPEATKATTNVLGVSPTNLWIGANSEYSETRNWDGLIDEVMIYNRALSQAEVVYLAGK